MVKRKVNSVYIHIPFCKNICSYCDFCKMYYNSNYVKNYLNSLKDEISKNYSNETIKTIYIGGGTPSSLSITELKELFDILKIFKLDNDFEFTIECNIEDITKDKIKLFKENKVNRISIGVESFNKDNLKLLNRKEIEFDDVKDKIDLIKSIGIENINIDFIYAIPNENMSILKSDLELFLRLDVPHISLYSLIIEDNTKLKINNIKNIDENLDYEMYNYIEKVLKQNDYNHYEVSNFSKIGYESKHNLVYWNNEHYYGFGLGASGYIDNIRYTNTRSLNKYLDGSYILEKEILTKKEEMQNEMILGLRKMKGVNKNLFYKKYNINIEEAFDIKELVVNKKLIDDDKYIKISDDYIYLSNDILINFID